MYSCIITMLQRIKSIFSLSFSRPLKGIDPHITGFPFEDQLYKVGMQIALTDKHKDQFYFGTPLY